MKNNKLNLNEKNAKPDEEPKKPMTQEEVNAYLISAIGIIANAANKIAVAVETLSMDVQDLRRLQQYRMVKADGLAPDDVPGYMEELEDEEGGESK